MLMAISISAQDGSGASSAFSRRRAMDRDRRGADPPAAAAASFSSSRRARASRRASRRRSRSSSRGGAGGSSRGGARDVDRARSGANEFDGAAAFGFATDRLRLRALRSAALAAFFVGFGFSSAGRALALADRSLRGFGAPSCAGVRDRRRDRCTLQSPSPRPRSPAAAKAAGGGGGPQKLTSFSGAGDAPAAARSAEYVAAAAVETPGSGAGRPGSARGTHQGARPLAVAASTAMQKAARTAAADAIAAT